MFIYGTVMRKKRKVKPSCSLSFVLRAHTALLHDSNASHSTPVLTVLLISYLRELFGYASRLDSRSLSYKIETVAGSPVS